MNGDGHTNYVGGNEHGTRESQPVYMWLNTIDTKVSAALQSASVLLAVVGLGLGLDEPLHRVLACALIAACIPLLCACIYREPTAHLFHIRKVALNAAITTIVVCSFVVGFAIVLAPAKASKLDLKRPSMTRSASSYQLEADPTVAKAQD